MGATGNRSAMRPALVAGAAVVGAAAMAATLVAVARPSRFDARLAAVEAGLDAAARRIGPRGAGLSPGDVCRLAPAAAVAKVRADLTAAASAGRLAVEEASVAPLAGTGGLTPYEVRLVAKGPYEGVAATLAALTVARPAVFVETADLSSNVSSVTLQLKGRVFCATSP